MTKLLFFGSVITLDLYLVQEIFLLNPCFTFLKNLILLFCVIYFKYCCSCLYCCYFFNRWISNLITNYSRYYWYLWYYTWLWQLKFSWLWQLKFYFTVNQWELNKSPKISHIFSSTTTSVFNLLLLFGVLLIICIFYLKYLLVIVSLLFILLPSLEPFISSL